MPPRSLLLITPLVLALHWLMLSGATLHWDRPPASTPYTFSTRTLAARPLAQPTQQAMAPAPSAPTRNAPPRKKAATRPPAPPPEPGDTLAAAIPADDLAPGDARAQASPEADPTPQTLDQGVPDPLSPAVPAASNGTPEASSAIAVTPPGTAAPGTASTAPVPVRLPAPMRLEFDVAGQAKNFSYNARAELLWQHDGHQYQARQEISVLFLGARLQTSVGNISAHGLLPRRFGDRSRSEQAAHFDYEQGRITFSANTPEAPLAPGAQDRLSVFLQLGAMLAAAPERYPQGTQVSITTVSARAADTWTFTVEGEETLDLPAGPTAALKLQRLPRRDYDQKAQLWLAPALGYLPARIRITQANGDFAELSLRASAPP